MSEIDSARERYKSKTGSRLRSLMLVTANLHGPLQIMALVLSRMPSSDVIRHPSCPLPCLRTSLQCGRRSSSLPQNQTLPP